MAEATEAAPEDTKFSGWLWKQGGGSGGLKNWKSRFFVLTSEKLLYYTDATLSEGKGDVVLSSIQSIVPFSQVRRECGIELITPDRVYVLAADDPDSKTDWVTKLSETTGIVPESVKFPDSFKGWLWKKASKGAAYQRHLFVLVEEQKKEKRFSITNFNGVPPPPDVSQTSSAGADDTALPLSSPPKTEVAPVGRGKTKLRLLAFSDEGCGVQTAGLASDDIEAVVLQEYGALSSSASPYLNWRLEVVSATLGTWVLAADTETERTRWMDEFTKAGIAVEDKRPSQQQWDYEGLLQTRKQNTSMGWKERYVRLAGARFVVFREQSSQVIKETIDIKNVYLETIKVKESGGTFRFRLYIGHEDDGVFMDWATTSEKLRSEWIKSLLAAGCKVASSDSQVEERARCDELEQRAIQFTNGVCLTDYQGEVSILKASRNVLASSYKKRFARLRGCRFSWAHYEESQDIDGIICIDSTRWCLHVYPPGSDKLWPFVLKPTEGLDRDDVTFTVGSEQVRDAWVSALLGVLEHGQAVAIKYVNTLISDSLAPAKEKLEATENAGHDESSDTSMEELRAQIARIEANIKREQGSTLDLMTVHEKPLEHEKPPDVRVTKKETKKKRTFGKRRRDMAKKTTESNDTDSSNVNNVGDVSPSPATSTKETSLPDPSSEKKEDQTAPTQEVTKPIVLPPQDERAEAKPAPVYPKNVALTADDVTPPGSVSSNSEAASTKNTLGAPKEEEKPSGGPIVLNISTGDGFVFHGRWTFDWLSLHAAHTSATTSPIVLAPPPEALAFRTDMGSNGELARCY